MEILHRVQAYNSARGVGNPLHDDEGARALGYPADVGEEGEIYLRGPSIAAGYWRQPEQTQKRFVDGWFRPGDVGRLDERGFLYFAGRDGDVIRTGGEKVFPREVEQVLLAHPDVVDACAYGRPDPTWGEAVHAVVALRPGSGLTVTALQAFCRSHLSAFKCPRLLKILEQIPRNAGGKVDRTQLLLQAEA
ncbi:MAG: fatty acid--CoA ligase family protein [Pigmentiphaga sp.]|nr:fatty acid--CoA ligase family protein [Pigmentiphaga sp.]